MKISKYAKAVTAAIVAGGGALTTALNDNVITTGEAWTIAGVVLGALGFTWAIPNKQDPKHAASSSGQ